MRPPVAIGGQGGSGTRVIAAMLQAAGYDIGGDLNRALDNLWYTVLLKRRGLDAEAERAALKVFVDGMLGRLDRTDERAVGLLAEAATEVSVHGHSTTGAGQGAWAFQRVVSLLASQDAARPAERRWAWKEPNSHIRLPTLIDALPGLRYVHVVRHGVDMALSRNQAQLYWWGPTFGIEAPSDPELVPAASLRYWVHTTRRAVELGERWLGERFLLVRFEDVCERPAETACRVLAFLGESVTEQLVQRLAALPEAPSSIGRHRGADLARFDPADLVAVSGFGYEVGA